MGRYRFPKDQDDNLYYNYYIVEEIAIAGPDWSNNIYSDCTNNIILRESIHASCMHAIDIMSIIIICSYNYS